MFSTKQNRPLFHFLWCFPIFFGCLYTERINKTIVSTLMLAYINMRFTIFVLILISSLLSNVYAQIDKINNTTPISFGVEGGDPNGGTKTKVDSAWAYNYVASQWKPVWNKAWTYTWNFVINETIKDSLNNTTNDEKEKYTFNNNKVEQIITSTGDATAKSWAQKQKESFTYNVKQKIVSKVTQSFSGSQWINSKKTAYSYNQNVLKDITFSTWNTSSNQWVTDYKYVEKYEVGLIDRRYKIVPNGSNWDSTHVYIYKYNSAGQQDSVITQIYNIANQKWVNNSLAVKVFRGQSNVIDEETISSWDSTNKKWVFSTKNDYILNTDLELTRDSLFTYSGNTWNKHKLIVYERSQHISNSIQNLNNSGKWQVFPNPAQNDLYIEFSGVISDNLTGHIIDNSGKIIQIVKLSPENKKIDVQNLTRGSYFLQINGTATTLRFIKQ